MDIKSYVSDPITEKNFLEAIIKSLQEYLVSEKPLGEDSVDKVNRTQLQKICFFTVRRLRVPVTTSWFIFGGYCHNNTVQTNALKSIENFELDRTCKVFMGDIEDIMTDYIKESRIFKIDFHTYMMDMYKKEAPEPYKELYVNHYPYINHILEFKKHMKRYLEDPLNFTYMDLCEKFTEHKDEFHKVFFNMMEFSAFHDIIHEYTFFLEQIAYKLQFITQNNESFPEEEFEDIKQFLKDIQKDYTNHIWGSIALIISAETIEGISAERIRKESIYRKDKNRRELPDMLKHYRSRAAHFNLLPRSEELDDYFGAGGEEYDIAIKGLQEAYSV